MGEPGSGPDPPEAARQARAAVRASVTKELRIKELRIQVRRGVEGFLQELLDSPANAWVWGVNSAELARALWREGLILVYRLLFILKLEASAAPDRAFGFVATSRWRSTYSPAGLAEPVRAVLDRGADAGGRLEGALRALWELFASGMRSGDLEVRPLGGMIFARDATPLLDRLSWGDRAVARLLDALLWLPGEGEAERERVRYGALEAEDLGRVYEALLELEPGIATEPMCRLRRAKLEVVVPVASRPRTGDGERGTGDHKVRFVEEIPAGRFFLRLGLGRKASGSYYTPRPFVRFLVRETLGPQLDERSPAEDPRPGRILELKVLDPAMGAGHFLIEACRYLGEALSEACRRCIDLAAGLEARADEERDARERGRLLSRAAELRRRAVDLPGSGDELAAALSGRARGGPGSGPSTWKARALCRRLVAVHCLYGVDQNPLAVELAKLGLWLESTAEGLPLTALERHLLPGDSLTGPFFEQVLRSPQSGQSLDEIAGLPDRLRGVFAEALDRAGGLGAGLGEREPGHDHQRAATKDLEPLKLLAAAWAGGVMLGDRFDDAEYQALAIAVANGQDASELLSARPGLREAVELGEESLAVELAFPEVFSPRAAGHRPGFDAVLSNPPWDKAIPLEREFYAGFDAGVLAVPTARERKPIYARLRQDKTIRDAWEEYVRPFLFQRRVIDRIYSWQSVRVESDKGPMKTSGHGDRYRYFVERCWQLQSPRGRSGLVLPNSFYTAEGSTGVRRLLIEQARWQYCLGYKNSQRLFEVSLGQRFCLVVFAGRKVPSFPGIIARFGATSPEEISAEFLKRNHVLISPRFIRKTSPEFYCLLECNAQIEVDIVERLFDHTQPFRDWLSEHRIDFYQEMNMTTDSPRFTESRAIVDSGDPRLEPTRTELWQAGWLTVHEKGTFFSYDDLVKDRPRYICHISRLQGGEVGVDSNGKSIVLGSKPRAIDAGRYFRVAARSTIHASEVDKAVFTILPPLSVVGNSALVESNPGRRILAAGLSLVALANSRSFNFIARLRLGTNLNQFLLNALPLPFTTATSDRLLSHSALRLVCSHAAFEPLWAEQLGNAWREPTPKHTWPVLEGHDARWAVRAAIDAVVADAYGLDRAQYEHILAAGSHKSSPRASDLCLAAFDELKENGPEAFAEEHDPYWDTPLNQDLPEPVVGPPRPD